MVQKINFQHLNWLLAKQYKQIKKYNHIKQYKQIKKYCILIYLNIFE